MFLAARVRWNCFKFLHWSRFLTHVQWIHQNIGNDRGNHRTHRKQHQVLLKVRPLPELNELSVRTNADGSEVPIQDLLVRGGTLKRSGSLRMKRMKMEVKQEAVSNEPSNFEV